MTTCMLQWLGVYLLWRISCILCVDIRPKFCCPRKKTARSVGQCVASLFLPSCSFSTTDSASFPQGEIDRPCPAQRWWICCSIWPAVGTSHLPRVYPIKPLAPVGLTVTLIRSALPKTRMSTYPLSVFFCSQIPCMARVTGDIQAPGIICHHAE